MIIKKIVLLGVLILVFGLVFGCTKNNGTSNQITNEQNNQKNSVNNAEQKNPREEEKSELEKFFLKMKGPEYKVTYEVKDFSGKTSPQQTIYIKGQNFRTDIEKMSTYYINNEIFMCVKDKETFCYKIEGQKNEAVEKDRQLRENWKNMNIRMLPSRNILGVNTFCIGYESGGSVESCYSEEIIPLYTKITTPKGTVEMIATSYSPKVSDDEFKLPVEPQEFQVPDMTP